MTATLASTARTTARTSVTTSTGPRRVRGAAPMARPVLGGPTASPVSRTVSQGSVSVTACRVTSPASRRAGLFLKFKVAAVVIVALVGVGVSTAEFASWSHADPSVEFVAGDPAWAHVTGR